MEEVCVPKKRMLEFLKNISYQGAIEMSISQGLMEKAKGIEGVIQWPYKVKWPACLSFTCF